MKLRAEHDLAQPRVVFRAAPCIEAEVSAFAQSVGAFFVSKPVNPNHLISVVDTVLAEPQPSIDGHKFGPDFVCGVLLQIARKLQGHGTKLESLNFQLDRGIAQRDVQIDVTRAAVDQEIKKRIWAEEELTQANCGLRDMVMRDALTGLYNRRYLDESLIREERRALRSGRPLAFMMIDVDYFKRINDTFGHAAGDAVLREVGRYLLSVARREDIVCRYGGEEFVLLMGQISHETIRERAETIRRGVHALKVEHDGVPVGSVSVSIGVGIYPDHGDNGQGVLQIADEAMYLAKQSGRNCVEFGGHVKA
jgi:diguanylate cyclase (GGDEF)-like protein